MRFPSVGGIIDRRILINYRIEPEVLSRILPSPFEPKLVGGKGIAGICLIRLKEIRPRAIPAFLGLSSENAAHRIAVQWSEKGERRQGVYIPRRDSSSWLNSVLGGRLFPGEHHHAAFEVSEMGDRLQVKMESVDQETKIFIDARKASAFSPDSVFDSLERASAFFEEGALGYSKTSKVDEYDGLELHVHNWQVTPLDVGVVQSSFFADRSTFPEGSVEFDCALLMQGLEHEWKGRDTLYYDSL